MKKLFFLCAFIFISIQVQAQLYIVTVDVGDAQSSEVPDAKVTIIPPSGIALEQMIPGIDYMFSTDGIYEVAEHFTAVNIILNDIISEGYKIIHIDNGNMDSTPMGATGDRIYYLAVPWTTVGLTEIDSSKLNFRISPNPAKEYINVEVDFKSQPSELVLISEQGYIYLKKDISNILSGQEFTVDISNVPAGKYLVTIKDNTQYLTPKK